MMRPGISHEKAPACCRDRRVRLARWAVIVAILLMVLTPLLAKGDEAALEDDPRSPVEAAVEAVFLCDPVPAPGHEVGLAVVGQAEEGATSAQPHLQAAWSVADGVGLAADLPLAVGERLALGSPGLSLKVLLRRAASGRTGLAGSLDLLGDHHRLDRSEAGLGLAAWRAVGPLTLRAGLSAASGVAAWTPHMHGGASATLPISPRVHALLEVVAEVEAGRLSASAGPGLKVALGGGATLGVGALFGGDAAARPAAFSLTLTSSL